ncbi:MAG: manganese efflux pump [Spirochaetales bacterium]|nr:manganese efflux pump [Spirochaetales bacterium]
MPIAAVLAIAVGLAMDAFAVSVSCGCANPAVSWRQAFKIGFFFGFFQFLMPVIGWAAGNILSGYIKSFSHILSFILLAFVGGKMIYESLQAGEGCRGADEYFKIQTLLFLAIATSLDALAAGFAFSHLETGIFMPAVVTGIITLVLSMAGTRAGCRIGNLFGRHAETAGGGVLVIIGFIILLKPIIG